MKFHLPTDETEYYFCVVPFISVLYCIAILVRGSNLGQDTYLKKIFLCVVHMFLVN